ncbi:MAG: YHS domain-containing (seleno)protein [Planktomarina sp.]
MHTRRNFLTMTAALPAIFTFTAAHAAEPRVYQEDGVAINGYDPVAYFIQGKPVEGQAQFTSDFDGATFRFASANHKAMFDENPAQYAPQYGGYCAFAVANGYTAPTDPAAWSVHKGKLYLSFSRTVRARWALNKRRNIEKADANWPSVLG